MTVQWKFYLIFFSFSILIVLRVYWNVSVRVCELSEKRMKTGKWEIQTESERTSLCSFCEYFWFCFSSNLECQYCDALNYCYFLDLHLLCFSFSQACFILMQRFMQSCSFICMSVLTVIQLFGGKEFTFYRFYVFLLWFWTFQNKWRWVLFAVFCGCYPRCFLGEFEPLPLL